MPDLRDKARALGLEGLSDAHLEQLAYALGVIAQHIRRLPRDLPPSQEMALTFRAKGPAA